MKLKLSPGKEIHLEALRTYCDALHLPLVISKKGIFLGLLFICPMKQFAHISIWSDGHDIDYDMDAIRKVSVNWWADDGSFNWLDIPNRRRYVL